MRIVRALQVACLFVLCAGSSGCGDGSDAGVDNATLSYEITIRVTDDVGTLGALQFEVVYTGDSGGWAGFGDTVACEALTEGLAAANHFRGKLKIGLVSLQGIPTPGDVVKCIFRTHDTLDADDFEVEVTDASTLETDPLPAPPRMAVTGVEPI